MHRIRADGVPMRDAGSTARLVLSDGCRNPAYRVLAPRNPWRDPANRLIVNFDFRVFMFQEMGSGDAIMITANIVACVEEIDCAPVRADAIFWRGHFVTFRSILRTVIPIGTLWPRSGQRLWPPQEKRLRRRRQ